MREGGRTRREEEVGQILHGRKGILFYPLLPPHPLTPHPTTTHAAMYAVFLGTLQTQPLAHVLHPRKGGSRLCMQHGKSIHFGGPKPATKSPPASPGTWGWEEAPGVWLSALDRTGHGVRFIRNHAAAVSIPLPATREPKSQLDAPSLIVQQQEAGE